MEGDRKRTRDDKTHRDMKVKDYFKEAFSHLYRFFQRTGQGVWYAVKRWFLHYPNPTWIVITASVIITACVQVGRARAERDHYGRETYRLQHQLDSIQGKQIKYNKTALWN